MMYNHTCDIADEMGIDDRWLRTCPPGVRSCFWAEARYDKQGNILDKIQLQKKNTLFLIRVIMLKFEINLARYLFSSIISRLR